MPEQLPALDAKQEQFAAYPAYLGSMATFAASLDEWYKPRTDSDGTVVTTVQQIHHDLTRPSQWLLDLGTPDDLDLSELHYFTGNAGQDGRTKLAQASMSAVFKDNLITSQEFRQLQVQGRAALQSLQSQIGDLWTGEAPLDLECQALFLINYALVRHELGIASDAIPDSETASRLNHACLAMTLVAGRIIARTAGEGRYPALFALPDQSHPLHLHDTVIGQALGYLENRIFISKSMSYISPWERIGEKQINNLSEVLQHIAEMAGIKGRGDMDWPKVKKWLDSLTEAAEEYAIALRTAQEETSGARLQAGVRQQELESIAKEREALRQQVQQLEAQLQSREARAAAAPETDWGAMVVKALKHAGPEQIAAILAEAAGEPQKVQELIRTLEGEDPHKLTLNNFLHTVSMVFNLPRANLEALWKFCIPNKPDEARPFPAGKITIDQPFGKHTPWYNNVFDKGLRICYGNLDIRVRLTAKGGWEVYGPDVKQFRHRRKPMGKHLEQKVQFSVFDPTGRRTAVVFHFRGAQVQIAFPGNANFQSEYPPLATIEPYTGNTFSAGPTEKAKKTAPSRTAVPEKPAAMRGSEWHEPHAETNRGLIRKNNEDYFILHEVGGRTIRMYAAVADGVGGNNGGEVASKIAIEEAGRVLLSESDTVIDPKVDREAYARDIMVRVFRSAHKRIKIQQSADSRIKDMGTTMVAAVVWEQQQTDEKGNKYWPVTIAQTGDSRAYGIGPGSIYQITEDHSVVWIGGEHTIEGKKLQLPPLGAAIKQALKEKNEKRYFRLKEQLRRSALKYIITKMLGDREDNCEPNLYNGRMYADTRFLLCSDGLWDMVPEEKIQAIVLNFPPKKATQLLIQAAIDAGGQDNITVMILATPKEQ